MTMGADMEPVVSTWRAAVVDLATGMGVAVEVEPSCDCASCLVSWWEDRTAWEADLLVHCAVPVEILPEEPGQLRRYMIGPCSPWDDDGEEIALWGPDALPVHGEGAEQLQGHGEPADAWEALALLVDTLDGMADAGA